MFALSLSDSASASNTTYDSVAFVIRDLANDRYLGIDSYRNNGTLVLRVNGCMSTKHEISLSLLSRVCVCVVTKSFIIVQSYEQC